MKASIQRGSTVNESNQCFYAFLQDYVEELDMALEKQGNMCHELQATGLGLLVHTSTSGYALGTWPGEAVLAEAGVAEAGRKHPAVGYVFACVFVDAVGLRCSWQSLFLA